MDGFRREYQHLDFYRQEHRNTWPPAAAAASKERLLNLMLPSECKLCPCQSAGISSGWSRMRIKNNSRNMKWTSKDVEQASCMNFYCPNWNCLMRHLITVCGETQAILLGWFLPVATESHPRTSIIDIIPAVFIEQPFLCPLHSSSRETLRWNVFIWGNPIFFSRFTPTDLCKGGVGGNGSS